MSENAEIYTADKNFTLLPAVTALTNFISGVLFSPSSPSGNLTSPGQATLGLLTELKGGNLELEIMIILLRHSRLNWT